jgi:hypothetical protein
LKVSPYLGIVFGLFMLIFAKLTAVPGQPAPGSWIIGLLGAVMVISSIALIIVKKVIVKKVKKN